MKKTVGWSCSIVALCFQLIQTVNAAPYGRLEDPFSPKNIDLSKLRCGNIPLSQAKCDTSRAEAVKTGCITPDEANKLKEWGMTAVCILGEYHGWCSCGCFDPETLIAVQGFHDLKAGEIAEHFQDYSLKHLEENSTIGAFATGSSGVLYSTSGVEARPLVVIETADGRILKLTTQHAVMTGQGEMIKAEQITPETMLLDKMGALVAIKNLRTEIFKGNVVNFRLDVKRPIEHIIFAEGIAVGDQAWQSTLEDLQNQVLIRQ